MSFWGLFGNQLTLNNDIEFVALVSLANNVLTFFELLFFEDIQETLSKLNLRVLVLLSNGREDFDRIQYLFIELSLFVGTFLHDLAEHSTIQFVELTRSLANNRSSSWSIVHQGQFSECFSVPIGLQVGLMPIDQLWAVVLSALHDEKFLSCFSLIDHPLTAGIFSFWHRFNQSFFILPIQILEKDWVSNQGFDEELSFFTLGNLV